MGSSHESHLTCCHLSPHLGGTSPRPTAAAEGDAARSLATHPAPTGMSRTALDALVTAASEVISTNQAAPLPRSAKLSFEQQVGAGVLRARGLSPNLIAHLLHVSTAHLSPRRKATAALLAHIGHEAVPIGVALVDPSQLSSYLMHMTSTQVDATYVS